MPFQVRCTECGAPVRLPDDRRGRKNYCPRCDARLPNRSAGGGAGWVVALVLGLVFVGGLTVVGIGVGVWYLLAEKPAAPVAQGQPVAAPPDRADEAMAPAFPGPPPQAKRIDPGPPPVLDPPAPPRKVAPDPIIPRAPGPAIPDPPPAPKPARPRVTEVKLPAMPARLPVKPLALTGRKAYALPEATERAIPAGGGRFLVLHFPNLRKAGVFDVTEGKVVRFINLPGDKPLLAAGMTKLAVYIPSAKVLRRYDLLSGEQEASKVLDAGEVKGLALGSASAGPLVVATADGGRLFDLDTLAELELPDEPPDPDRPPVGGDPAGPRRLPFRTERVWAAANGRLFVGAGGFDGAVVTLEGGQVKARADRGEAGTYAQPSADGRYVFRGGAGAVTADGQKTTDVIHSNPDRGGFAGYFFLPAADGPYYFHVNFAGGLRGFEPRFQKDPERAVTVYMYGLDSPLARVLDLPDVPDWSSVGNVGLPFAERLHLIPRANLLVTIGPSRDRLTLVPLDLNQALDEAGIDFLMVSSSPPGTFTPGHEFRYPIRARSKAGGLKFALEAGPDGMKVGPDGLVTWKVPAGFGEAEVMVIAGLKDASGKEVFHNFRLVKSNVPERYVPDPEPEPVKAPPKADARAAGPRAPYRLPPAPPALAVEPAAIPARTEVRVPEKFDAAVAGGDGRFVVLHARAGRKAFVFDLSAAAVARTIELADDKAVLAAGMTQLFVYRGSDNTVERVNLLTGASEGRKAIPTRGVTEMVLGSASAGPLFVRSADRAELYDAESLLPMDVPRADGFPFPKGPVWASADGRTFGNSVTKATGSFVQVAALGPDSIRVTSELKLAPYAVPGPDGKRVYVAGHGELTAEFKEEGGYGRRLDQPADPGYYSLPAPGGAFFLMLHLGAPAPPGLYTGKETRNGVTVWHREQRRAGATVEAAELTADLRQDPALPALVHYQPEAHLLAVTPPGSDRVVLYPVRLGGIAHPPKKPIAWRLPDAPPPPTIRAGAVKERKTLDLPGRATKVAAGGGGRYVVYQTDPRRLSVFDVNDARVVREVATDDPIGSFAAGMAKLVVTEQTASGAVLRRYDLGTGKLEATAGMAGDARRLVMGSASAGPVVAVGLRTLGFCDLATLAPMTVPGNPLSNVRPHHDRAAVSGDGRTVLFHSYGPGGSNRPVAVVLTNDGVKVTVAESGVMGSADVSADGRHLFLGGQGVFTPDLKKAPDVVSPPDAAPRADQAALYFGPAADGPYYLHLHLGVRAPGDKFADDPQFGVTIYEYGRDKPVGRLPSVVGRTTAGGEWLRTLRPSGVYHFVAAARLLVAVDPNMSRLHLVPVDPANMPVLTDPDPWPTGRAAPKTASAATRPKGDPAAGLGPLPAGKPFRLAALPEPLPITPVAAARTVKLEAGPDPLSPPVAKPAGGGRFLLVQAQRQRIDVFDLNAGKVVRQLELPPGATTQWAAGMSKAVVYDKDLRALRRFDLLTGKEDLKKEHPSAVTPKAMGLASDGPVLCQVGGGLKFVDLATLELMELESGHLRGQEFTNKTLWASADGRAYGAGLGGLIAAGLASGAGTVTLKLVGPTGLEKASGQFPSLYAVPDPTGRYLFAGGHGVYDLALGKTKDAVRSEDPSPREPPVHYYLPAVDGPFYLRYHATAFPFPGMVPPFRPVGPPGAGGPPGFPGVPPGFPGAPPGGRDADETGVTIYGYGQAKPVARLKDADPLAGRPADPFSLARVADQLFLIPRAKVLVVFRPRDLTIELVPIDLEAEMAKSGVEVPWVTSVPPPTFKGGAEVRYPLKVVSRAGGVKYSLDDPPAGMAVSADGVLTWTPPADTPAEVRVTVRVRDAKGGESVHSFPVTRAN